MSDVLQSRELWAASAEAWVGFVSRGDVNRDLILDEPVLDLIGDVRGLKILDLGCGEGRFSRMLAARGGSVTGLDPTPELLVQAGAFEDGIQLVRAGGEELPFADASFDLVVVYLVLIDIPDFRRSIVEMGRVLKPGGRLVVANMNSFVTTRERAWIFDADGTRLHVAVDNYFEERALRVSWAGMDILNWHRPQEAYFQALLGAGLTLESYAEPRPKPAAIAARPDLSYDQRVPMFHTMSWRK